MFRPAGTGRGSLPAAAVVLVSVLALGCVPGPAAATPPIEPGTAAAPRDVNLITRDYSFVPDALDLVPGETIVLHVINGGLVTHEAVIGGGAVQDAWEVAEAATVGAPPGPTPVVTVPADVAGLRVVVRSGELVDIRWTVPADAATAGAATGDAVTGAPGSADTSDTAAWLVGCHIPGHWAKGMVIPIRWVTEPPARGQG